MTISEHRGDLRRDRHRSEDGPSQNEGLDRRTELHRQWRIEENRQEPGCSLRHEDSLQGISYCSFLSLIKLAYWEIFSNVRFLVSVIFELTRYNFRVFYALLADGRSAERPSEAVDSAVPIALLQAVLRDQRVQQDRVPQHVPILWNQAQLLVRCVSHLFYRIEFDWITWRIRTWSTLFSIWLFFLTNLKRSKYSGSKTCARHCIFSSLFYFEHLSPFLPTTIYKNVRLGSCWWTRRTRSEFCRWLEATGQFCREISSW